MFFSVFVLLVCSGYFYKYCYYKIWHSCRSEVFLVSSVVSEIIFIKIDLCKLICQKVFDFYIVRHRYNMKILVSIHATSVLFKNMWKNKYNFEIICINELQEKFNHKLISSDLRNHWAMETEITEWVKPSVSHLVQTVYLDSEPVESNLN